MPNPSELARQMDEWQSDRCGHNYPPQECPHAKCGYKEALAEVAQLKESLVRYEKLNREWSDECRMAMEKSAQLTAIILKAMRVDTGSAPVTQ